MRYNIGMDIDIKNKVEFGELLFWKSFLIVFVLFQIMKLSYILVFSGIFGKMDFFDSFVSMLFPAIFSLFHLVLAFVCSFVAAYFITKRLINKNPEKVFTFGLLNLSLVFFFVPLPLWFMFFLFASDGSVPALMLFGYWIVAMFAIFSWLYLSTLCLYRYFKKQAYFLKTS
jgi:hypothetical protein